MFACRSLLFISISTLMMVNEAGARVFDFNNENFSSYLRGGAALSQLGAGAFEKASGAGTRFSDEVDYNFSGEIGAALNLGESLTLRLGLEVIQARPLSRVKGVNGSGAERMAVTSDVFAYSPSATLEFHFFRRPTQRAFVAFGVNLATAQMENQFALTPLGHTEVGIPADYTEKAEGSSVGYQLSTGYEVNFADTVTFVSEAGYRYLDFNSLKHTAAVSSAVGNYNKGDALENGTGVKRSLDLSGAYVMFGFRFYIKAR